MIGKKTLLPWVFAAMTPFVPLSAHAETSPGLGKGCQVFEHKDFKGRSYVMPSGVMLIAANDPGYRTTTNGHSFEYIEVFSRRWNDDIGSVKMGPGCRVTLYEHVDKRGKSKTFAGNTARLGWWNDEAGRASCLCDK
ncbi:hypothetical protein HOY34_21655 [Xinfangfangia sp. D13-10-4-6]|uniref:hypothetical protein n=1 Tax=Pseudogemmobacter hezensis TaxID=2737662 RepID=UPI001551ACF3|nr:hypothetical protein [Pseudogemmobacter hezensis]NPD17775.1 hypothetical protein [Pseudogemmobacter hezensis]